MRNKFLMTFYSLFFLFILSGCIKNEDKQDKNNNEISIGYNPETLNLSIIIDLSDRLVRTNVNPSQVYNDTALVNYFIDYFIKYSKQQKTNICNNKFQILFYPTPNLSNINNLSKDLSIDLGKIKNEEKGKQLKGMKYKIDKTLDVIYSKTIESNKWEGSDIWGLFSNRQVDKLCIKDNCRNIIVLLTDGYLYHVNHKLKEGNAYSYVLPQTLQAGGRLISKRDDLSNVEIIILEINPYLPTQRDQLFDVLQNWFKDMGVDTNKLSINETDVENRTEIIIENFLNSYN